MLEKKVGKFKQKGEVVVMGDINARTGNEVGPNGEASEAKANGKKMLRLMQRQHLEAANG